MTSMNISPRSGVHWSAGKPRRSELWMPSSPRKSIPDLAVHDLRRTVGTNLARLGVSKDIRARILNHVEGERSVTDTVYNQHEFWADRRPLMYRAPKTTTPARGGHHLKSLISW